ncbi:MAG: DUF2017 domain-containing protein [Actinomycetota bacterium]|nr:DUF2017 domain-containing protein [Actinomycetota bacterium]
MPRFKRAPDNAVRVRLGADEAELLRRLASEMRTMLDSHVSGDPVVQRLFPDAHLSPEEAADFRALTEDDLSAAKRSALDRVTRNLETEGRLDVTLGQADVDAWLSVLTDLRLAIGTRLEVTEELMSEDVDPSDERAPALATLHWLGWVQEMLLRVAG